MLTDIVYHSASVTEVDVAIGGGRFWLKLRNAAGYLEMKTQGKGSQRLVDAIYCINTITTIFCIFAERSW